MWKELPKHASLGAIAVAFMGIASLVVGCNCRGDWMAVALIAGGLIGLGLGIVGYIGFEYIE